MVAAIKGLGITNAFLFADSVFGESGSKLVIDSLSQEDQQVVSAILSVGWYDLELYARVLRQLARVHGHGALTVLEDYGRFAAKRDIGTVYKLLFRITNPGLIFDQAMKLWDRYHNTGRWRIDRTDHKAIAVLSDWGYVDEAMCRVLVGYIESILAHGNCKQARVVHTACRAQGAPQCVFNCSWH